MTPGKMGSILVLKVLRPEAFVLREYDPRVNRVNRIFLNERTRSDHKVLIYPALLEHSFCEVKAVHKYNLVL